jgi:glycosyltransferase involved in cell wall biosynthesis
VARIHPDKRHDLVFEAMAHLRQSHREIDVLCIGEAYAEYQPLLEDLKSKAALLEVADSLHWLGFVDDMSIPYSAADLLLIANPFEPLGRSALEGLTFSLPVVAPASGGSLEIVQPNVNGVLFDPGNASSLAASLERVLFDQSFHAKLAAGAKASASRFSLVNHVAAMSQVFERAIESNRSRIDRTSTPIEELEAISTAASL